MDTNSAKIRGFPNELQNSKSTASDGVPVRVRSPAPKYLPLFDTIVSARVGIFICTFTLKQGDFLNFATLFDFRCQDAVGLPTYRIAEPLHIALLIR